MKKAMLIVCLIIILSDISARNIYVSSQTNNKKSTSKAGSILNPYKTINEAAQIALPGDTVYVFGGIYRERVAPANSGTTEKYVVYKAINGEQVIIKGSEIWNNAWQKLENSDTYTSKIPLGQLQSYNPFYIPLARFKENRLSLGQIFVDSHRLSQVDSIHQVTQMPGTWTMGYDSSEIYIHLPVQLTGIPIDQVTIEYTAREKIFAPHKRGLGYIHVEGFIMEHCANQFPSGFYRTDEKANPQAGALSTRAGHHWIIRRNTIRLAKSLGLDCGYEGPLDLEGDQPVPPLASIGFHRIENNIISHNGCGGIAGAHQRETIIRYNIIEGNNYLGHTAPETGGIKVHFFYDGIIEGNIVRDNHCLGIWLDNEWYRTRVSRNLVANNTGHGIFVEMGNGDCLIDNNIIAYQKTGEGIYLHDASGVTIAHNLLYANMHFGVYARVVTERNAKNEQGVRELVGAKNLKIFNNIFVDNYRGHICLPYEDGTRVANNKSDYNLFINGSQWQWEGLGFNSFTIGNNDGRIQKNLISVALQDSFEANNYPDSLQPNFILFEKQPLLQFDWWKMLTNNDQNSIAPEVHTGSIEVGAVAKGEIMLEPSYPYLKIGNMNTFHQLYVPEIENINVDYFGEPIPEKDVLPGPIQQIQKNDETFYLIPKIIIH